MARFSVLRQIQSLDPERDHQRIVFLSKSYDFAFDTTRALEFALYRTYCVPSISALLDRTGEFRLRPQKRYDDTDLIVSTLMEWGYDSEQGRAALRRMNQIHGRFEIANDDLLYVLSTFVFEPIRWNARFGWRPLCDQERQAYFLFWREVGRRMNIREIPATYEAFERFNVDYERVHFRFSETNQRVGAATRDLFLGWFPGPLRPMIRPAIYAMMGDTLIDAFGFPRPSRAASAIVMAVLKLRAWALYWCPARRRPHLRSESRPRSYPQGYRLEDLGPPFEASGPEGRTGSTST
jgi:ER-bound oxygenase mpaB/B'/Rubber oxygenase, catalytic domain